MEHVCPWLFSPWWRIMLTTRAETCCIPLVPCWWSMMTNGV
jgi:hypothetical protein